MVCPRCFLSLKMVVENGNGGTNMAEKYHGAASTSCNIENGDSLNLLNRDDGMKGVFKVLSLGLATGPSWRRGRVRHAGSAGWGIASRGRLLLHAFRWFPEFDLRGARAFLKQRQANQDFGATMCKLPALAR